MIPVELTKPSTRTMVISKEGNELARRAELDLIKEDREKGCIQDETMKQQIARKYNKRVILKNFEEGELGLRKIKFTENH